MEFEREFIVIGNAVQIRYYGIIIVIAMLAAAWVAARLARRDGQDPDHVWGALTWAIIPGIIGARLWFVFFPPASLVQGCFDTDPATVCQDTAWMLQNFFNTQNGAIAIWSGGLGIWGAVLGGMLGMYLYMRRHKLSMAYWLDIAGVVLPLAQGIGRFANYVNQELYGTVTTLPWGITIDSRHRVAPWTSTVDYPVATTLFHPLFLYEALWSFIAFFVLLQIWQRYRNRLRPGDIFLMYIIQYTFIRFLLEFLRAEPAFVPGTTINSSQVMSVIGFVIAAGLLVYRHRPGLAERPPAPAPAEQSLPEQPAATEQQQAPENPPA
jgi:phosphatidylglycerol:prolipoprotein diacylglycerol transferase